MKRHSPGGLEYDSCMPTEFVQLKNETKEHISKKDMAGIWMDEITSSQTKSINSYE